MKSSTFRVRQTGKRLIVTPFLPTPQFSEDVREIKPDALCGLIGTTGLTVSTHARLRSRTTDHSIRRIATIPFVDANRRNPAVRTGRDGDFKDDVPCVLNLSART